MQYDLHTYGQLYRQSQGPAVTFRPPTATVADVRSAGLESLAENLRWLHRVTANQTDRAAVVERWQRRLIAAAADLDLWAENASWGADKLPRGRRCGDEPGRSGMVFDGIGGDQ